MPLQAATISPRIITVRSVHNFIATSFTETEFCEGTQWVSGRFFPVSPIKIIANNKRNIKMGGHPKC